MTKYFCEIVADAAARIITAKDMDTPSTIASSLGGTWVEVSDPYLSKTAFPYIGQSADTIYPVIKNANLRTVFPPEATKVVESGVYSAWPYNNLNYDTNRDKLWFHYMEADAHITGDAVVKQCIINTTDDSVSTPVTVISDATYRTINHGSCIAANGDYIAFVIYRTKAEGATVFSRIWRSTDGGDNWSLQGDLVDDLDQSWGILEAHGCYVTSSGAILVSNWTPGTTQYEIYRSTDNGYTWTEFQVTNNISGTTPLEPIFHELSSGRIISNVRAGLSGSQTNPLWHYSDDDGVTWSELQELPVWWNQYSNPGAFVWHSDVGMLELFVGHRDGPSINGPFIYQMIASETDAASMSFGGQEMISGGVSTNNDFGYPTAARVGNKVYILWYDGGDTDTDIYMMVGNRP